MENSKRGSIPMQENLKLSKSQGASTPAELKRMQNVPYASAEKLKLSKSQGASTPVEMKCMQNVPYALAVGSIMYAVRCTRPDVAFA
uniref:Gag/Pol protein n=1 Tax=Tanacetum cinerariifolium TaxID=118510 RepID=A0A699V5Y5_TANCI|nr:Gag/Pol protein [Tanacetum cinerariifolium]